MGIIPAHAGLTEDDAGVTCLDWDHPRACGAHFRGILKKIMIMGSSPRMRGSLEKYLVAAGVDGIIPAHAGLTIR